MDVIQEAKKLFENCSLVPKDTIHLNPEVRKMCEKNRCGHYGRNWTCPPALPELEEIKQEFDRYDNFALIYQVYPIRNNFDMKGMLEALSDFQEKLVSLKKALKGKKDILVLGAGGCGLCPKCSYPDKPCRRPEDAIVSLEAYGIEVVKLMMENGLKYNNGPETVTYIGGVMF
ncbi:MAG: DUF2284 domain-containing protein [Clostridia bacterium]|jgi:predicted metal-binding protein|nr:DUF2284 domain-containing protein [Clostridia bacterium]